MSKRKQVLINTSALASKISQNPKNLIELISLAKGKKSSTGTYRYNSQLKSQLKSVMLEFSGMENLRAEIIKALDEERNIILSALEGAQNEISK